MDVTGFGLLGHLHEMVEASGIAAKIDSAAIAAMAGVLELLRSAEPPIAGVNEPGETIPMELEVVPRPAAAPSSRSRAARVKPAKPKRVQRMFAIEEDLDKKLWLYAIHLGKDRSEVVNDLLRPIVASMVLYDSRDRRGGRSADPSPERGEADGDP